MNKIKLTEYLNIYLYKKKNFIFIITEGIESPFYYKTLFKQTILNNLSIEHSKVTLYIDMLSCVGSTSQRFLKLNLICKQLDYSSIENIEYYKLPAFCKQEINNFYKKHLEIIINNKILSNNEKQELLIAI